MKHVLLVHGFNVKDRGQNSTDKLRKYFEAAGYTVRDVDYARLFLLGVRLCDKSLAMMLAALAPEGSIGVGHSNGCAILREASLFGAPFSQLVFINPALNKDASIGPQVKRIHVWHSPGDIWPKLGKLFIKHAWGDMGSNGYKGKDPRFVNYDKSKIPPYSKTHSDVFEEEKLKTFGPMMVGEIERVR